MKNIFRIFSVVLAALILLPACSKEDYWELDGDANKPHQNVSFKKVKEASEVNNIENIVRSTDAAAVDLSTFVVEVSKDDKIYYNGSLADLPEILSLPVGVGFKVVVHSPENPDAAWDTPYYEGSQTFDVVENDVTFVEPVVCKLANVKVSIVFDSKLLPLMEDDCKVTVETGTGASLVFAKGETRSGFFRYAEAGGEATLVATFSGTVDENFEENFRTYTAVAPGNHYIITYTLHGVEPEEPDQNGSITLGLVVDSSVDSENLTVDIDYDDPTISDTDRPQDGGQGEIDPPVPEKPAPTVTCSGDVSDADAWTKPIVVPSSGLSIKVTVHSDPGITGFTVDIDSETLTPEILDGVGLASHLDLVNPGDLAEGLASLGFPVNVAGQTDPAVMDITEFTSLLGIYGAATHKFIITVTDANGTTKKTLTLVSQ